ncbi:hypothetical protein CSC18_3015 [Klebsiella aerogenes]|nr:hypothetical protein CSC18_3015 [Klebsiella aerogenes]
MVSQVRYPVFFPQQGLGRSSPDKAQRAAIRGRARLKNPFSP